MAINWKNEADNITDTTLLFEGSEGILNTKDILGDISQSQDEEDTFDINRVVMWISKDYLPATVKILGKESYSRQSKEEDKLITGQKVIRLKKQADKVPIIYWNGKSYVYASVPKDDYLGNTPMINFKHQNLKSNFLNEATRVFEFSKTNDYEDFKPIREQAKAFIEWLEQPNVTNTTLINLKNKFDDLFSFQESKDGEDTDTVGVLETYTKAIFSVLNPIDNRGYTYEESTIVVPITRLWLNSLKQVGISFSQSFLDPFSNIGNSEGSDSGEGIKSDSSAALDEFKAELISLKEWVGVLKESDEKAQELVAKYKDWFDRQLTSERLEKVERFIFIHSGTWIYKRGRRAASFIGTEVSFAVLQVPPLLTILIHELNVNAGTKSYTKKFSGDSHMAGNANGSDKDHPLKEIWEKQSKYPEIPFKYGKYVYHEQSLASLYHSNGDLSTIILAIFNTLR